MFLKFNLSEYVDYITPGVFGSLIEMETMFQKLHYMEYSEECFEVINQPDLESSSVAILISNSFRKHANYILSGMGLRLMDVYNIPLSVLSDLLELMIMIGEGECDDILEFNEEIDGEIEFLAAVAEQALCIEQIIIFDNVAEFNVDVMSTLSSYIEDTQTEEGLENVRKKKKVFKQSQDHIEKIYSGLSTSIEYVKRRQPQFAFGYNFKTAGYAVADIILDKNEGSVPPLEKMAHELVLLGVGSNCILSEIPNLINEILSDKDLVAIEIMRVHGIATILVDALQKNVIMEQ